MNKLKKITTMVTELKTQRDEEVKKVKDELEKVRSEMNEASNVIELTDDTNEYMKALTTIEVNKKLITVLNRRLNNVSHVLSKEDFKGYKSEVLTCYNEVNNEYSTKINKGLNSLLDMLREYNETVDVFKSALNDLEDLADIDRNQRRIIKAVDISQAITDGDNWYRDFIIGYFRKLYNVTNIHRYMDKKST